MCSDKSYETTEFAEIYDAVYADRDDAGFWHAMAESSRDGRLLEIGCGTGRVLLPLARAGYAITGIDLAPIMIQRCRAKLSGEPAEVRDRVQLLVADAASFDFGERFQLIMAPFGGFHHLQTVHQQLACLEQCRAHLAPGGLLVLDLFNPDPTPVACLPDEEDDDESAAIVVDWRGGLRIRSWMTVVDYDRSQQCNHCEMIFEILAPDGCVVERTATSFVLRYVFRYELEHLLARCGFRLVALYGDYDQSPFGDESLGMIAVAAPGDALDA